MNYWDECIHLAFAEAGVIASEEQMLEVAGYVEACHDNYWMAHAVK